jgi:hypothetical protein
VVLLSNGANFDQNVTLEPVNTEHEGAARRAQVLGGYSFIGLDLAAYQPDGPLEQGLRSYLEAAKARPVWNASATDVARWWRAHEGLTVASAWDAGNGTLTLDVTAKEAVPFPAAIAVSPPPGMKNVRIDVPASAGAVERQEADGAIAIVLSALPPGSHRLQVRFAP